MDGTKKLRAELDRIYLEFHRPELLAKDPLGLVSGALEEKDFEVVSFISASLSYGRVEQIQKSLLALWKRFESLGLEEGGGGLHRFLVDNSGKTIKKEIPTALKGWVHRFNDASDMSVLFHVLSCALKEHASLGAIYCLSCESTATQRLEKFVEVLRSYASGTDLELLKWFTCSPREGSTCKRMVMWLRWMLRSDEIDPGLWTKKYSAKGVGAHLAFIPMDTHVHKWALQRALLTRKSPSWKSVEELTAILREVDPMDPARFDFAICHSGMSRFRAKT